LKSLELDPAGFEDLAWWGETNRAQAVRLIRLIRELQKDPFSGIGRPEPLKHELKGCWLRRIDHEYQVLDDKIRIIARRYHHY
jgi:toxin YoeB